MEILKLFGLKSAHILKYLELPEEKAVLNTFRKLKLWRPSQSAFANIKKLLNAGTFRHISHLRVITEDLLAVLADFPAIAQSKLIQRYNPETANEDFLLRLRWTLEEAENVGLGVDWVARKLAGDASFDDLSPLMIVF
jgi:hypothetical protein